MERPKDPIRRRFFDIYLNYVRKSDYGRFFNVRGFEKFLIFTNSYCNLHCEFCSSSSNNLKKVGYWEISIEDVKRFCELFRGVGNNDYHRLVGGETTALPLNKFDRITQIFAEENKQLSILTNGFRLMRLNPNIVNRFKEIVLDDHGINSEHIKKCKIWLKKFYNGKIHVRACDIHYDLEEAIEYSNGFRCALMKTPTLYKSIIYPCCNMGYVADYHLDSRLPKEFERAGWSIQNDNLLETLKNWRKSLPKYAVEVCLHKCWQPNCNMATPYRITLKKHDVVADLVSNELKP